MKIICFAGPNGSGKTSISKNIMKRFKGLQFVNADIIAKEFFSEVKDEKERNFLAAVYADKLRDELLKEKLDFAFESVMSDGNSEHSKLKFLHKAKEEGYEIDVVYVLTRDANINVERVKMRVNQGGHNVPEDKIRLRHEKCMRLLPDVMEVSDKFLLFDNTVLNQTKMLISKNNADVTIINVTEEEYSFLEDRIFSKIDKKYNIYNIQTKESVKDLQDRIINETVFDNDDGTTI